MTEEIIQQLVQFGVAGLMGVLWFWERLSSRKFENQITEAHKRIVDQDQHILVLIDLIKQNTHAIERFDQTQRELNNLLRSMHR